MRLGVPQTGRRHTARNASSRGVVSSAGEGRGRVRQEQAGTGRKPEGALVRKWWCDATRGGKAEGPEADGRVGGGRRGRGDRRGKWCARDRAEVTEQRCCSWDATLVAAIKKRAVTAVPRRMRVREAVALNTQEGGRCP